MQGVGVCQADEIALSVLCTVIGHQQEKGWVLVDAGWMAMSRDRGTQAQDVDYGYGAVCNETGSLIDGLLMSGANQEHGILSWRDGRCGSELAQQFPVGTRLRVLPNHACATAAQFPHYDVLGVDGQLSRWNRFYGW
jgi:threo-3-hydroxy-D-aspartate ammonia-lyase